MDDIKGEDIDGQQGQRQSEKVEVSVVSLAHTVPHPRTVMIEAVDAVVTDAAVRRSWRSEDLTGVAVLEFDDLVVDLNVADSGWGALPSRDIPIGRLYLHLNKSSFVWESPGQHPWVTEAGPQQHGYDEEEDDDCEYGDGRGQVDSQVRTFESEEERAGPNDEE